MIKNWLENIKKVKSIKKLEETRIAIIGKNGELTKEFSKMKLLPNEEKKDVAKILNEQKQTINDAISKKYELLKMLETERVLKKQKIDIGRYNTTATTASLHPVTTTMDKITTYFANLNFKIEMGPVVEDEFHNFEALNLPKHHPARDMQDTFYCEDEKLLRTHTSPVQIRTMMTQKPPIRMIAPGQVFRRDFDITHTPMFTQVEGLVVQQDEIVSFANLKFTMEKFLKYMFGDVKIRFRPSFFPFTEPSAEVDISCIFCKSKGCQVCSRTGWLEVLGCGIVDQNVFKAVGYKDCSGYAFGLGVERFAMLLHEISDLRSLFESDIRLLGQFR